MGDTFCNERKTDGDKNNAKAFHIIRDTFKSNVEGVHGWSN